MNYWLIFAIALAAMATALVLAYILKSRLSENDVWEELLDSTASESPSESEAPLRELSSPPDPPESSQLKVEPMTIPTSTQSSRPFRGADLRRSSRIERPVPLVVMGTNRRGESFQEKTSALSFNLHGCCYSSRHDYPNDGWVTLQVTGTDGANPPAVRARVRSVLLPTSPRELSQVGVELETPANVWGVEQAPEDWSRILTANGLSGLASAAAAPALAPVSLPTPIERKAEVTVFPSPNTPPEAAPVAAKPERLVLTPDQLLQALQGKLQQAADRAIQTAISAHLNESVRIALGKIDDVWKSNVRQAEEFSTARLGEAQSRWERELVVYRSRAEEVSRRLEALAAGAQQNLAESQRLSQQVQAEIEPLLGARLKELLEQAKTEFAVNVAEVSGQHVTQIAETAQSAVQEARAHFDGNLAEMRSLTANAASGAPGGITDERMQEATNAARSEVLQHMEDRLAEIWGLFEQQQDLVRDRTDEIAASLRQLTSEVGHARASHEQSIAEIRSVAAATAASPAPNQIEAQLQVTREQLHNDFEWRLGEVSAKFEQLHTAARRSSDVLNDRLDALAAETRSLRLQHEQALGELRSTLANIATPVSQERLDWLLNSTREQLLHHIESRIGEVSSRSEQQHDMTRQQAQEIAQRMESLADNTRAQLEESRALAQGAPRSLRPEDVGALEQGIDRFTHEFENAAARVSDRQLVRLHEQKQALASEASIELEARTTDARSLLQKTANGMLDELRRRADVQIGLVTAEATERVSSTLASLDAENRAACDARRRTLEREVARAAEQSMAEFRSGIKAFLYSCLVAAVSAVDQHAQTTLAGLNTEAASAPATLENSSDTAVKPQTLSSASASASDTAK
jgi:hypothetical protein